MRQIFSMRRASAKENLPVKITVSYRAYLQTAMVWHAEPAKMNRCQIKCM